MIFLKWYTFTILTLSLLINLYESGSNDDCGGFILLLFVTIPAIIYVFLS